jgi:hypothetical protein
MLRTAAEVARHSDSPYLHSRAGGRGAARMGESVGEWVGQCVGHAVREGAWGTGPGKGQAWGRLGATVEQHLARRTCPLPERAEDSPHGA